MDDLRPAFCILTTRRHRGGGRRLQLADPPAFHRGVGRRRFTSGSGVGRLALSPRAGGGALGGKDAQRRFWGGGLPESSTPHQFAAPETAPR